MSRKQSLEKIFKYLEIEGEELDIDINLDPSQFDYFNEYAVYCDWKVDLRQTMYDFNGLLSLRGLSLEIDESDFNEDDMLPDWAIVFNNKLRDLGYSFVYFNADWDSYCYTIVKTSVVEKLVDEFDDVFMEYGLDASYLEASLSNENGDNIRKFEFKDDKSNKFWNISWTSNSYTVHYGRIGADGTKKESVSSDVNNDVSKLIKSKVNKGYVEVKVEALSYYDKQKNMILEFISLNTGKDLDMVEVDKFVSNDITYHKTDKLTEQQTNELSFMIYEFAHVYKHVRACYQYAYFTYHGLGTKKDIKKAMGLLEVAAHLGHDKAKSMYAANVFAGHGTNYDLAVKFAEDCVPNGYWTLAVQYLQGEYIPKDLDKALHYAHLCMEHKVGSADAIYTMTMQCRLLRDDLKWLSTLENPTESDLSKVADLALEYYYGSNNRVYYDDYPQEFMNFLLKHNHPEGKFMQGVCIERGYNKECSDKKLACKYVEEAAEAGSGAAYAMLAYYYEQGVGCKIDVVKGYEAALKGAELGNPHGYANLGECYLTASGVEENLEEAEKWLKLAIESEFDHTNYLRKVYDKLGKSIKDNSRIVDEYGNEYSIDKEKNLTLTSASKKHKHMVIPFEVGGNKVKYIKEFAFSNNPTLETINLPTTIEFIGTNVFKDCKNLRKVDLPKCLKYIGASSFMNCESLEEISIPESLLYITNALFYGCSSLESIKLPNTLIYIGESSFEGCTSLVDFKLHEGLQYIKNYAFRGCRSLVELDMPDSIISSELTAFVDCPKLSVRHTMKF